MLEGVASGGLSRLFGQWIWPAHFGQLLNFMPNAKQMNFIWHLTLSI